MGPAQTVVFDVVGPLTNATDMITQGGITALLVVGVLKAFHVARRMLKNL